RSPRPITDHQSSELNPHLPAFDGARWLIEALAHVGHFPWRHGGAGAAGDRKPAGRDIAAGEILGAIAWRHVVAGQDRVVEQQAFGNSEADELEALEVLAKRRLVQTPRRRWIAACLNLR